MSISSDTMDNKTTYSEHPQLSANLKCNHEEISHNAGNDDSRTTSQKKKVLNTRKVPPSISKEETKEDIPQQCDDVLPSKIKQARALLASIEANANNVKKVKPRVSSQLAPAKNENDFDKGEQDYTKAKNLRPANESAKKLSIDLGRILKAKQALLQASGLSSIKELVLNKKEAPQVEKINEQKEETKAIPLPQQEGKLQKIATESSLPTGNRIAVNDFSEKHHEKRVQPLLSNPVRKRNFGQLSIIPQSNHENDSPLPALQFNKTSKHSQRKSFPRTIAFFDTKRKRLIKFPVFDERDLKFLCSSIQHLLHKTSADNDVETDDEQIDRASTKMFEDLLAGLSYQCIPGQMFRPRYFKDPKNPKRRVMCYSKVLTEGHKRTNYHAMNSTKESYGRALSSASTSARSHSWGNHKDFDEKYQSPTFGGLRTRLGRLMQSLFSLKE